MHLPRHSSLCVSISGHAIQATPCVTPAQKHTYAQTHTHIIARTCPVLAACVSQFLGMRYKLHLASHTRTKTHTYAQTHTHTNARTCPVLAACVPQFMGVRYKLHLASHTRTNTHRHTHTHAHTHMHAPAPSQQPGCLGSQTVAQNGSRWPSGRLS